jgi:hypothetical protein
MQTTYETNVDSGVYSHPDTYRQEMIILHATSGTTGTAQIVIMASAANRDGGATVVDQNSCMSYSIGSNGLFLGGLGYTSTSTGFTLFQSVPGATYLFTFTLQPDL